VIDGSIERLPGVEIDVWLMEEVFNNLIDNAIKYAVEGTDITVSGRTTLSEQLAHVTVANIGLQISHDEMGKIFEQGYRGRLVLQAGRAVRSGAGLGLFVVKRVAELHKGDVSASSMPTQRKMSPRPEWSYKTEFTVTIPTVFRTMWEDE
jgi:signal transduction histidine kinase